MTQTHEMQYINRKQRVKYTPLHRPYRTPEVRVFDFSECSIRLTPEEAMAEASRCLHCPDPSACVSACPVGNDIPSALWYIEQGEFEIAAELYRATNPLPEICGRVCPGEASCATSCVLTTVGKGMNTRGLEAFVTDWQRETTGVPLPQTAPASGKRVAVIGAGPAGLTVAEDLRIAGHEVTVIDANPVPGGLLVYGIPSFKLCKELILWKADWLEELGVEFRMNTLVGKDVTIDDLLERDGFDAVFAGTGAQVEATMDIPGEDLSRVYGSLDFLVRANVPSEYRPASRTESLSVGRRVAVIGGGDTATDCMRSAIRLGAEEVICYYRRTEAEMPGNAAERHHAIEEGAQIIYLTAPVALLDQNGDGAVDAMQMITMELGEPDSSGRRRPVPIEGSEYIVEVDDVVMAIGFWPDPLLGESTPGLETRKWGLVSIDKLTGATSRSGVFAGGDNVTGPALVNEAIAAGKRAASAIDVYLSSH